MLEQTHLALHGFHELRRVVANSLFEYDLHVSYVGDTGGGIPGDDDEIRLLPHRDRADPICSAEIRGSVQRPDLDCFEWREAAFDEQLELALIRVPWNHSATARRVGAGDQ